MKEEALHTGKLEETNEPHAVAKLAGFKLCNSYSRQNVRDYGCVISTNYFGPSTHFHPENSNVTPPY